MYIIQYIVCLIQGCVVLEHETYVVYKDVQSCEVAASIGMKELIVSLDNRGIRSISTKCVDKSNSVI